MDPDQLFTKLQKFASTVISRDKKLSDATEHKRKLSLIDPFLNQLDWDVRDPEICEVEAIADLRGNQRVDYALKDSRDNSVILIEAKVKLKDHNIQQTFNQLHSYFAQSENAEIGVITDGCKYLWFVRKEGSSHLHKDPFLNFDARNPTPQNALILSALVRTSFSPSNVKEKIGLVKLESRVKDWIAEMKEMPSPEFTKFVLTEMERTNPAEPLPLKLSSQTTTDYQALVKRAIGSIKEHGNASSASSSPDVGTPPSPLSSVRSSPPPNQKTKKEKPTKPHSDHNKTKQYDLTQKKQLTLPSGEVLYADHTNKRAYRFKSSEWKVCPSAGTTFRELLDCFARNTNQGPRAYMDQLSELKSWIVRPSSSKPTTTSKTWHGKNYQGKQFWIWNGVNNENRVRFLFNAADLVEPAIERVRDYDFWLPFGFRNTPSTTSDSSATVPENTSSDELLKLHDGTVLSAKKQPRAYRLGTDTWIVQRSAKAVLLELIDRFARSHSTGPEVYIQLLTQQCRKYVRQSITASFSEYWSRVSCADQIVYFRFKSMNNSTMAHLIDDAARMVQPPLSKGKDYDYWIPATNRFRKQN